MQCRICHAEGYNEVPGDRYGIKHRNGCTVEKVRQALDTVDEQELVEGYRAHAAMDSQIAEEFMAAATPAPASEDTLEEVLNRQEKEQP